MPESAHGPVGIRYALRTRLRRGPLRALRAPFTRRREQGRALARALDDLQSHREHSDARIAELTEEVRNLRWWLQQTCDRGAETAGRLEAALADRARDQERLEQLVAGDVALDHPGGLELETFDAGLGGYVRGFRHGPGSESEGVYVGFEDWFRGAEAEISERLTAYVPLMRGSRDVLDLGCGRGEFLGVMRDAGIRARGVDIDPAMVERARQRGFDVMEGDAVSYLLGAPGRSCRRDLRRPADRASRLRRPAPAVSSRTRQARAGRNPGYGDG